MNDRRLVYISRIPIRWSDMDAMGHVNNTVYFRYLEQARIEWFATIGEDWVTDTAAPVVASATLHFKRPIEYPADVFVELFTERLGTTSVVIGHRIVAADGTLHCDGNVVAVWVERRSGKPTPLPPAVRRASERIQTV